MANHGAPLFDLTVRCVLAPAPMVPIFQQPRLHLLHQVQKLIACLALMALQLLGAQILASQDGMPETVRITDHRGTFTVSSPVDWRVVHTDTPPLSQIALYSAAPFDVSVVVASRRLSPQERSLTTTELMDRLIELSMINVVELGNTIIEVGRTEPQEGDWPAFALVARSQDSSKIITVMRSPILEHLFVVTTLTDNSQGSTELAAIVNGLVSSVSFHPPEAESE